jgi:hypothetical protein
MIEEKVFPPVLVSHEFTEHLEWVEYNGNGYWQYPEHPLSSSITRLVAIIPFGRIEKFEVSRRITHLAYSFHASVLVLGLSPDAEYWYREHFKLNCIASAIQSCQTPSRVLCSGFSHWDKAIKEVAKSGDMFVCFSQHQLKTFLWKKQPIGEWLNLTFNAPVFVMENLEINPYLGL